MSLNLTQTILIYGFIRLDILIVKLSGSRERSELLLVSVELLSNLHLIVNCLDIPLVLLLLSSCICGCCSPAAYINNIKRGDLDLVELNHSSFFFKAA